MKAIVTRRSTKTKTKFYPNLSTKYLVINEPLI